MSPSGRDTQVMDLCWGGVALPAIIDSVSEKQTFGGCETWLSITGHSTQSAPSFHDLGRT